MFSFNHWFVSFYLLHRTPTRLGSVSDTNGGHSEFFSVHRRESVIVQTGPRWVWLCLCLSFVYVRCHCGKLESLLSCIVLSNFATHHWVPNFADDKSKCFTHITTTDVIYFDESIDAKMNRYTFKLRNIDTPFLLDRWVVCMWWVVSYSCGVELLCKGVGSFSISSFIVLIHGVCVSMCCNSIPNASNAFRITFMFSFHVLAAPASTSRRMCHPAQTPPILMNFTVLNTHLSRTQCVTTRKVVVFPV